MPDTLTAVKRFVVDEFLPDVTPDQLDADLDLLDEGVIDSLGLLKVIAWIESTYDVDTDEVDLDPDAFRSAASISAFVDGVLPQRAEAA
ncbi:MULTISPECIES: phosphopantetheine-binding protein [unclassified Streptomyces]|uniref:phosphopantetheine-binding protein n=1 Tax=unclassified Streptomyces TaxID=2593676 RepID=UPI003629B2A5